MRRTGMYWLVHFCASVAGWYILGAAAQGVVDSSSGPSALLRLFNIIIQLLLLPLVFSALRLSPVTIGDFSLPGFFGFVAAAALNSALVVCAVGWLIGRLRQRRARQHPSETR